MSRARKIQRFLSQPFFVAETVHRHRRASTSSSRTPSRGFKEIVDGKCDDIPEQAFYMQGGIDDVRARAEQMKEEAGQASA